MALNDNGTHPEVAAINNRLGISRTRKPLTPEQLENYRPAKADPTVVDTPEVKELALLLGYIAGPNFEHRLQVARYILSLETRIVALEPLEQRVAELEQTLRAGSVKS
jgi:hypothetical protein